MVQRKRQMSVLSYTQFYHYRFSIKINVLFGYTFSTGITVIIIIIGQECNTRTTTYFKEAALLYIWAVSAIAETVSIAAVEF